MSKQAVSPAARTRVAPERASRFTADDQFLFNEGTHYRLADKLGAHLLPEGGVAFAVWAPSAQYVSVVGDFNGWDRGRNPMQPIGATGVWEAVVPEATEGTTYKFHISCRHNKYAVDKADPFGFQHETPPKTGSVVRSLDYTWGDSAWMKSRGSKQKLTSPMSVYEVHLGSWMRVPEDNGRSLTYRELAPKLAEYLKRTGFTHAEFLPIMEHPFYGSWGYQTTGYFAPTSRFGSPQDFMYLIDHLHQQGIGVILDWVPSHFPNDEHGLAYFDGTHLFEHEDARQGFHPDWKSAIFNYGRHEVRAFLISSAIFWLEKYHVDGLRVDAVASMLYLDYGRKQGEWVPNEHGGRENLEAIHFLRQFNTEVFRSFPDVQTIAEESTAWPMVSRPTYIGGLGFGMKWDMGWMHDTLRYFKREPIHRRYHHNDLNFRGVYMFSENYMLPLSHDEVVHLKGSLLTRMPGDPWQRFANLRLLLTNQWTQPGKKLLFMGGEFGQWAEWNHDSSLDWHLCDQPLHHGVQRLVTDLNAAYRRFPALHEGDCAPSGFEWVDANDAENSTLTFLRKGKRAEDVALIVFNCTPVPRSNFRVGVPGFDRWNETINTDAIEYGGSGVGNYGSVDASPMPFRQFPRSLTLNLPPLGALILTPQTTSQAKPGEGETRA
ncbi:MAG: 1,4-alpha-glucan branching protein GlgB [Phycisphaeraceae bacterium]|nr:1,4-alpha-glucan branching protein GlgB [Phycisphaeraceae bacterium]